MKAFGAGRVKKTYDQNLKIYMNLLGYKPGYVMEEYTLRITPDGEYEGLTCSEQCHVQLLEHSNIWDFSPPLCEGCHWAPVGVNVEE